jgi:hypothetical protein
MTICRKLVLVTMLIGAAVLTGCSTRSSSSSKGSAAEFWYGIGMAVQTGQCSEIREPERRDACYKSSDRSYEEYERLRKQK